MTNVKILRPLKNLPPAERLKMVESTMRQLRQDLGEKVAPIGDDADARLAGAADALLDAYCHDRELTALADLDVEVFLAQE